MQADERLPELAHRLGELWEVKLGRSRAARLLDVLVMSAERDPVLVRLRELEAGLGVLQEPVKAPAKKLARSDAAANSWSRICGGIAP